MKREYTQTSAVQLPLGRKKLTATLQAAGDVIRIDDVVAALSEDRGRAAKRLARWTKQGYLRRVGRGAYVAAPIEMLDMELVLDSPWVLVPVLYAPAYIGGFSAAEYWGLTDQTFRVTLVMTARPVRKKRQVRHGARFELHHIQERKIFGTEPAWHGRSIVPVSDVHRTIIDILANPGMGGGIDHVAECFESYFMWEEPDEGLLIKYAEQLGNGAVFKRLGFLASRRADASTLAEACHRRLTKGNAKLDPPSRCSRLISKWRLWVPEDWLEGSPG